MNATPIRIYSVFHKPYPVPPASFITPVQVNKKATGLETGFVSDDTGDNIADKNERFCEYTALYWIWRQLDQLSESYIGLSHYRRYFTAPVQKSFAQRLQALMHSPRNEGVVALPLNEQSLQLAAAPTLQQAMLEKLEQGFTIVPHKERFFLTKGHAMSLKEQFILSHLREDWEILENAIKKVHPEDYRHIGFFNDRSGMRPYNMFIGSKQFLGDYCGWVFPILFEIERTLPVSPYPYQRRAIGFMGERLFNFYLHLRNIRVAEFPIVFFE